MRRIDRLMGRQEARSSLDLGGYQDWVSSGAFRFPFGGAQSAWSHEKAEPIGNDFGGYAERAYKANGIVFAVTLARLMLFTEATFKWRDQASGKVFGSPALRLLEEPWPNGTTGDLLARMEQDVTLSGNFYGTKYYAKGREWLRRLRPDWVEVVVGSSSGDVNAVDATVAGYLYHPGGKGNGNAPELLPPEQVCHFAPIPDPTAQFRGMSWLTPVLTEVQADGMATRHKRKFFENAATPNVAVSLKESVSPEAFQRFVELFRERHRGWENAYETLFLGGGADTKVIGADMRQLDFKATQGAGETRICAAGGVPPIIVGLSEGLQASTYSNYGQARRKFGDHWARPQWRNASASLASLVTRPPGARLWYDTRDIAFLQEDEKDTAEINAANAATVRQLIDAGFTPESAVTAVTADNFSLLEHTGFVSVQLQDPNATDDGRSATPEELTMMIQKIYLGVGTVLTADEARKILNDAGAGLGALPPGFGDSSPTT